MQANLEILAEKLSEWPIVWISAAIAIVVVGSRYLLLLSEFPPTRRMGSAELDLSSSWATTLTTVGAVLGTVLSTELLKGDERLTFVSQNILFGVIVVFAGLVYSAVRNPVTVDSEIEEEEKENQGYVGVFVIACALTLWAVAGELLTILTLLRAIADPNTSSSPVPTVFATLMLLALVCFVKYTWQTMKSTLEALPPGTGSKQNPSLPKWSVL